MTKSAEKVISQIKKRHRLSLVEKQRLGRALAKVKKQKKKHG